jgi:hypothetical protein
LTRFLVIDVWNNTVSLDNPVVQLHPVLSGTKKPDVTELVYNTVTTNFCFTLFLTVKMADGIFLKSIFANLGGVEVSSMIRGTLYG